MVNGTIPYYTVHVSFDIAYNVFNTIRVQPKSYDAAKHSHTKSVTMEDQS